MSPLGYPFGWNNHKAENKFLQPEGWLDKIQLFTDEIGKKVVNVPADCHHNKEYGVFMKEGEWHFFSKKIIVHLVKQTLTVAPVVIKFNYLEAGHLVVVSHDCPVGKIVTQKQVSLSVGVLIPGYHITVGFVPTKWRIFNRCYLVVFEPNNLFIFIFAIEIMLNTCL